MDLTLRINTSHPEFDQPQGIEPENPHDRTLTVAEMKAGMVANPIPRRTVVPEEKIIRVVPVERVVGSEVSYDHETKQRMCILKLAGVTEDELVALKSLAGVEVMS